MKQRIIIFLLALTFGLSINVKAETFTIDGLKYERTSDNEVMLIGYEDGIRPSDIKIPDTIKCYDNNLIVTAIGANSFIRCYSLTSVEIPNTVISIGDRAFYACYKLSSVEIPNSVISIGYATFQACQNLESVVMGESVKSIGGYAFAGCFKLANVKLSNALTEIGEVAFCNDSKLTSIDLPNSLKSIGASAFSGCSGLSSIKIPNSVKNIERGAFLGCSGLTLVEIPDSVDGLMQQTFYKCSNLKTVILGNSVISMISAAFASCENLKSIILLRKNCWPSIAFSFDSNLPNITFYIPHSLESKPEKKYNTKLFFELTPSEIKINAGDTERINVVQNADMLEFEKSWSSADENIAIVDNDGNVTAINTGETTVTFKAKYKDNEYEYPVKVNVDVISGIGQVINGDALVDVYNFQGIKVLEQVSVTDMNSRLSKGLYIVNGKKVLIN